MLKRCILAAILLFVLSATFGAENQATRLSIQEMKNIKGGASMYFQCGPDLAPCGEGEYKHCLTEPAIPEGSGVLCDESQGEQTGLTRYLIPTCTDISTPGKEKCDHEGDTLPATECGCTWKCRSEEITFWPEPIEYACVAYDRKYFTGKECRAYND